MVLPSGICTLRVWQMFDVLLAIEGERLVKDH